MATVPYRKLSKVELDSCLVVMREGNTLLKMAAEMLNAKRRKLRKEILNSQFNPCQPQFAEEQVEFLQSVVEAVQAIRKIEWKMICGFSGLVRKVVYQMSGWNQHLSFEDYEQEGLAALIHAIYGYTREDIAFITYARWAIRNRIIQVIEREHPLHLCYKAVALLKKFNMTRLTIHDWVTDIEVYERMNLSREEIAILEKARVGVNDQGRVECETRGKGNISGRYDYTAFRRNIQNEKNEPDCNFEIREAYEKANLSPMEREIVDASLLPYHGWREDIASRYINPKTDCRYTRAAINGILEKAQKKIRNVYLKLAS